MICGLSIQGLTVVESLDIDLNSGFTVLTGETGAGKSILLTAMGLALGDRADAGYIRPGFDRAEINLEFDILDSPEALALLKELEIDSDNCCIVRRILSRDGRSKAFINNCQVTLQILQQLGERLIDIHGQHAHLSLLAADQQRQLLDETGNNLNLVKKIHQLVDQWKQTRDQLKQASESLHNASDRKKLLQFQIEEMESLEINSLNYQALVDEHTLQANIGNILNSGQAQLDILYEQEQNSVSSLIGASIRSLSELSEAAPQYLPIIDLLDEAQIQIQESSQQLRRYLDSLEADPQKQNYLDDRLAVLHSLARKHQIRPEELPQKLDALGEEINQLENNSEHVEQLKIEYDERLKQYQTIAEELSVKRKKNALRMEKKISTAIQELGMPQGQFKINISRQNEIDTPSPTGFDRIDFRVSTNPGLPLRSLNKVASGGELSRISLAIQVAAIDSNSTATMVFDEVDSGIGGGIAEIVGDRLRKLGSTQQVLCITHLPQVAAQSHHHLLVEKASDDENTQSRVRPLDSKQRQQEIARMLGGIKITEQTLAHAGEMLGWIKE